jgi:GH35 family endo-1,4-beta-xylanase
VKEHKELLIKRFREIGECYAKYIPMIEVTNESFLTSDDGSAFFHEDDFCEWSFREAQKVFPANALVINEAFCQWDSPNAHTNRNPYYMQVEKLLSKGVPVHGLGLQYHQIVPREVEIESFVKPTGRYAPQHLYAVMDKLSQLNLPLQITEITIPAYSMEEEDEALQAEVLRNVYSIFFSHRAMEAIIYWNIPDGYHYGAEPGDLTCGWNVFQGGLLHFDLSEKPAYRMLDKLIHEDWTTRAQIVTDEDGYATLRGFHGEYELTVHANEKAAVQAFHLGKNDLKNQICLTL